MPTEYPSKALKLSQRNPEPSASYYLMKGMEGDGDANKDKKSPQAYCMSMSSPMSLETPVITMECGEGFVNILENIACRIGACQWPLVGKRLERYKICEFGEAWT